ncbi:MAG: YicC/YloC family endoribonuclease [Sneathiella sp.]
MTLQSMTGFARTNGTFSESSWVWEVKSVNGRGLEVRSRIPGGFDRVEDYARKYVKQKFQRGTFNLNLQIARQDNKTNYQINHDFLNELLSLGASLVKDGHAKTARIDGMFALKGVIEQGEAAAASDEEQGAFEKAIIVDLNLLIEKLAAARLEEGQLLEDVLVAQLDEIEDLVGKATRSASLRPENVKERLKAQMESILSTSVSFDEGRLEQELALLATKADVSEELDRLGAHISTVRDLLKSPEGGIGRRLDFMCQEFNREANTLCSKANDKELTQIGLDMKVVVDRLREQVQNIE